MDSPTKRFLILLLILFVTAVALQLNGSSVGIWKHKLHDDASPEGVLFSTPKFVRSDEWIAWTPSLLSQALHKPPFPLENANVGVGKTPLLISLPVRHVAMFFRPQLYGFFLFDVQTAYAFYWNVKVFGLIVSFFLLFRLLTGHNFWMSIFGTGWLFFSAYIQWWFSCPPMLPEMLASWAGAIVCIIFLFQPRRIVPRILIAIGLLITVVNFVLCFYPPFQIPLIYVGAALLAGWFWQNKGADLAWRPGIASTALAGLAGLSILVPYIQECRPTLELLAGTSYPGLRRSYGGELKLNDTFNGLLGFFNSAERDYLDGRGNACEASNFYPLWLIVLLGAGYGLFREHRARRVEIMLLSCLVALTLYSFCPFPHWLCDLTLLNYVTGARSLLGIGLGGILITTLILARPPVPLDWSKRIAMTGLTMVALALFVAMSRSSNQNFLTPGRCLLLFSVSALFISLYFFAPAKLLCPAFLTCLILNNGLINPVGTGLGPLLEATPASAIREINAGDPEAKWVAYSSAWLPQFLKAQGADVIAGLSVVPDLDFCREIDPSRKYESIYNRYALAIFLLPEPGMERQFQLGTPAGYSLSMSPLDPVLQRRRVRYAAFPEKLNATEQSGIRLMASFPKNDVWIYKLPAAPDSK